MGKRDVRERYKCRGIVYLFILYDTAMAVGRVLNGLNQEAILYLQKAIQIDHNYADAYFLLGNTYSLLNKYKEAKGNLEKAKELFEKQGNQERVKATEEALSRLQ